MENNENGWVAERLAVLDPDWRPNAAHARQVLEARLTGRKRSWNWIAAATTAAACLTALAFPATRAIGQGFWDRFVLNRVAVVRVDLSRLPLKMHVTTDGLEENVGTVQEAERKAGFRPYLWPSGAELQLTVSGPMTVEQVVHTRALEAALSKVGASDLRVPAEWDGVTLRTEIGPIVSAIYPDGVHIVQCRPFEFSVPSGFRLERFTEAAFRSIGVSWWEARALGQRFAAHPSWLQDLPVDQLVNIQDVRLDAGPALLIENLDQKGMVAQATLIVITGERMYSVSSRSRDLSMRIAGSLR